MQVAIGGAAFYYRGKIVNLLILLAILTISLLERKSYKPDS